MINKKIAIIGLGNMGSAIKDGILKKRLINKSQLFLSHELSTNTAASSFSDILIIAVKPQVLKTVFEKIKNNINKNKLIISIAAGVEIQTFEKILGKDKHIIRVMPNLCAKINRSISCWVKNKNVSDHDVKFFKYIFQSIGTEIELKNESFLDQVTAISGSGPAYFFYLSELLLKSAIRLGLEEKIASQLVAQTFIGSAVYLKKNNQSLERLRQKVTSKGGTTEAAFKVINNSQFEEIFFQAITSAYKRAQELHYY